MDDPRAGKTLEMREIFGEAQKDPKIWRADSIVLSIIGCISLLYNTQVDIISVILHCLIVESYPLISLNTSLVSSRQPFSTSELSLQLTYSESETQN